MLRYQKKLRRFVYIFLFLLFLTSGFVLNFVCFRDIIAGFDIDESYNYIQDVLLLCHMLITRFCLIIKITMVHFK